MMPIPWGPPRVALSPSSAREILGVFLGAEDEYKWYTWSPTNRALMCIYIYIIIVDGCAWWIYVDQNPSMLVTAMLMFDFLKFTRISDENLRFCWWTFRFLGVSTHEILYAFQKQCNQWMEWRFSQKYSGTPIIQYMYIYIINVIILGSRSSRFPYHIFRNSCILHLLYLHGVANNFGFNPLNPKRLVDRQQGGSGSRGAVHLCRTRLVVPWSNRDWVGNWGNMSQSHHFLLIIDDH